jgi:WD40 repeat protein
MVSDTYNGPGRTPGLGEQFPVGGQEIQRFQDAVRARIEWVATDTRRNPRDIPPDVLAPLVCAAGFSSAIKATGGAGLGALAPPGGSLAGLISAAIDSVSHSLNGQPGRPEDLEREIFRRIQQVLTAGDAQVAAALRADIASVLGRTGALQSALLGAIETGDDRLRGAVIAAIDTLSSAYPEMGCLLQTGDRDAADLQRHLDGQDAEYRTLGERARRQSAAVRILREDLASVRQRQGRTDRGHSGSTPDALEPGQRGNWAGGCPYRGLLPFDQAHAGVFCGRQRLTAELMVKLSGRLPGPAMVVVSGASGAGKSSLLHAGLLPALGADIQLEGSGGWPRVVMTPAGDPLTELAGHLAALGGGDAAVIRRELAADPDRAPLVIGQAVQGRPAGRLVLVVDQFEEVFTLASGRDDASQRAFIAALCAAAAQPYGPRGEPAAVVVIAVRGDYWARCAAHAGLARMMQDGLFVVGPMTGQELREAITGPAAAAGLQVDPDLADAILADLDTAGQGAPEGVLPLLSQAMMLTWEKRDGHRLTAGGYHETGGVARCVEFGAEAVYGALPDAAQHVAREIFQTLVLVSPDGQLARCPAIRADLYAGHRDADRGNAGRGNLGRRDAARDGAARRAVDNVLEAFAERRLLVLDGDTVQIAHDVLLNAWPRLRGWLDREQASRILHTQLQEDATRWDGHGRDSSFLYRGGQLTAIQQAATRWAADPARYPDLTHEQSRFLAASRQHAARGTRIRRAAVLSLALLLVLAVAGAGIAARADRTASQQRDTAVSAQLAAKSETLDANDPVDAARLAAAAWRIAPTPEAQTSLLDVLAQPTRRLITAANYVSGVAFSPDGRRFVTAGYGWVQIWDVATGREIGRPLNIGGSDNAAVAFRRDGDIIAVTSEQGGPGQLWNVTTRSRIGPPIAAGNGFSGFLFNPGGTLLATVPQKGSGVLLDLATRHPTRPYPHSVEPMAFSPGGQLLAISPAYGTVQLYGLASRQVIRTLSGINGGVAFSSDGKIIAAATQNSVIFWDVATGRKLGSPIPVAGASSLSFSPDGQTLAIMGRAGATLWETATRQQLGGVLTPRNNGWVIFTPDNSTLAWVNAGQISMLDVTRDRQIGAAIRLSDPRLSGPPSSVAFSPDGKLLGVAGGADVPLGLWSVATRRLTAALMVSSSAGNGGATVDFSPNGKILASSGPGGTSLWSVATHRQIGAPNPDRGRYMLAQAFDPRGPFLAVDDNSGRAWLWDVTTGRVHGRPLLSHGGFGALAFSPDGTILAVAGGSVRLFSVATLAEIGKLSAPYGVLDVAFSPDGRTLATGAPNGAILWNIATKLPIGAPLNTAAVQALAFSPDGTLLATASKDGMIRLYDAASHQQVGSILSAGSDAIQDLAFSPDGSLIATANGDGTVRIWGSVPTNDLLPRVCALAGGSLTKQQWNSDVPSVPYQKICP